jgi:hypothetical protein
MGRAAAGAWYAHEHHLAEVFAYRIPPGLFASLTLRAVLRTFNALRAFVGHAGRQPGNSGYVNVMGVRVRGVQPAMCVDTPDGKQVATVGTHPQARQVIETRFGSDWCLRRNSRRGLILCEDTPCRNTKDKSECLQAARNGFIYCVFLHVQLPTP